MLDALLDPIIDPIIERALAEDLQSGDLTTESIVDPARQGVATAIARAPLIVCGSHVFARVFSKVDAALSITAAASDGERATEGEMLWTVEGSLRSILFAERTALNFVQRLSGIASLARRYVDRLGPNTNTRITDTRKTTPGLRVLERYAVRVGGAINHRDNLGSAVLIKDNHIAAAGGVRPALERAKARATHTSRIEIEVKTMDQLQEVLELGADIIMLDNFDDGQVEQALALIQKRALVEVSGGVAVERIERLSSLGVDFISVGALTHSAPAADVALDIAASE